MLKGGGIYAQQQPPVQQFAQAVQNNIAGFGQQSNFSSQPNALGQLSQIQGQMGMPVTNQMNLTQNHIGMGTNQMVQQVNSIGSSLHMGQVNQINGLASNPMAMQNQMVR